MKILKEIKRLLSYLKFNGSTDYWIKRYANGGNSGVGSNSRLQDYKADYINDFIKKNSITTVLDMGVGDGEFTRRIDVLDYRGIDVSTHAIQHCKNLQDKGFINPNYTFGKLPIKKELGLSLDVMYHLIENEVYWDYLHDLFENSSKYVIIYAYEHNDGKTWAHVKPRWFTEDIQHVFPNWELVGLHYPLYRWDKNNPDYTTKSRFYIYKNKDE